MKAFISVILLVCSFALLVYCQEKSTLTTPEVSSNPPVPIVATLGEPVSYDPTTAPTYKFPVDDNGSFMLLTFEEESVTDPFEFSVVKLSENPHPEVIVGAVLGYYMFSIKGETPVSFSGGSIQLMIQNLDLSQGMDYITYNATENMWYSSMMVRSNDIMVAAFKGSNELYFGFVVPEVKMISPQPSNPTTSPTQDVTTPRQSGVNQPKESTHPHVSSPVKQEVSTSSRHIVQLSVLLTIGFLAHSLFGL